MNIQFQSAVFFVQDIDVSRRFYQDLLEQEVLMDHGPNVGFVGGFALWQVEHACETIFEHSTPETEQLGRKNCEIYFETHDLEAVWERLSEASVRVIHPMREQPWGQRVFRVCDPDGHIVELGEPMPVVIQRFLAQGMTAKAIAQRTSMPVEIVRQIAQNVSQQGQVEAFCNFTR